MKNWLEEMLDNYFLELEEEKKNPHWFSISAISNVPYIKYPGFTEEECKEIQDQTKNILRISRDENKFKEVAITYNRNNPNKEYYKVMGDFSSIPLMSDKNVSTLINRSNKENELVVISIHNHPNNSKFSINDLLIFTENPSIKLMQIVNKNGEVSFLLRPYELKLHNIVFNSISESVSDFKERIDSWKLNNSHENLKLSDLLNFKERTIVSSSIFCELIDRGVIYSNYINQEQSKIINFNLKKSDNFNDEKFYYNITKFSLNSDKYEYLENGEDGYEWE